MKTLAGRGGCDNAAHDTPRLGPCKPEARVSIGVRDRVQAVITAYESGLVHPEPRT
jgi:hypothetical protein